MAVLDGLVFMATSCTLASVHARARRRPCCSARDPYDHDFVLAGTRIYDGNDVPFDYLILDADFSSGLYMLPERDRAGGEG